MSKVTKYKKEPIVSILTGYQRYVARRSNHQVLVQSRRRAYSQHFALYRVRGYSGATTLMGQYIGNHQIINTYSNVGTVSPQVAAMPESLLSALPSLPDITTTRLPREVVNLAPVTSPAMNISEVIPNEPLYQNLLQAVTNPVIPSSYPLNPLDRY